MSSISFRRPEFRLDLAYPEIVLTHAGRTLGTVGTEVADLRAALARLAETVRRARGRLVAVLPEDEVCRGRLDLAGRGRAERRASARSIVAARLGATPDAVTVVLGPRDAAGSFPIAGVRRSTLAETRALLAAVGLRPAAIVGAGVFAGFAAAPRLGGWSWRLPAVPQHRRGLTAALGAGAVATLALVMLGHPTRPTTTPVPAPTQAVAELAPEPVRTPHAVPRQVAPQRLALHYAERPKPRPALRPEAMVTVAARNMPDDLPREIEPPRRGPVPQILKLAQLTTARVRTIDASMPGPLRRPAPDPAPAPEVAEIARTAMPGLPAPAVTSELRPMPRPAPAAPAAAAASKPAPAAEGAALAPRPRAREEASQAAVLVASLDPAPFVEASLAAATAAANATHAAAIMASPPPARPAARLVAKAAPVAAKPVVAKPKPVVVRPTPAAAKPVAVKPLLTQAAPQRQVRVAPAPQRVATAVAVAPAVVKPAAKPVRQKLVTKPQPVRKAVKPAPAKPKAVAAKPVKANPATQRVGLSRRDVSLVGVFAGADGRHALVRLPNGNIERVKAGDRLQGVQVAAINVDSIRLTGRGKDTLLRLPD